MDEKAKIQLNLKIRSVRFEKSLKDRRGRALVQGTVHNQSDIGYKFRLSMMPDSRKGWAFDKFIWIHNTPRSFGNNKKLREELINSANAVLKTVNMWPGEQTPQGANIVCNEIIPPVGVADKVISSFRSSMLNIPSPSWEDMWDIIESRIDADPYFKVNGLHNEEFRKAVHNLRKVFPPSWVEGIYRNHTKNQNPGMGDDFPPQASESWFPAYHLARAAQGAICIDPGWNYLVEIGLSIEGF